MSAKEDLKYEKEENQQLRVELALAKLTDKSSNDANKVITLKDLKAVLEAAGLRYWREL